jgi:hypothetical protein
VLAATASGEIEFHSTDDTRIMSTLASATAPMIVPEIVKAVISLRAEPFTERNVRLAAARVRDHLRRFLDHGLVREIRTKGNRFSAWVLATHG